MRFPELHKSAEYFLTAILLIALIAMNGPALSDDNGWRIGETPAWVVPVAPWTTPSAADAVPVYGIEMRLHERQQKIIRGETNANFIAYEYLLANRVGVEDYSSISIDFDPIYENVVLHELSILRNDRVLDKLPSMRANVLQRERDLDYLLFDGEQTLNLVVHDVRVDDVLRVAYTIHGSNPIFGSLFESSFRTERSGSSVGRYYNRLIVDADEEVVVRRQGPDVALKSLHKGKQTHYVIDQTDVPIKHREEDVIDRFYDRGFMVFSNVENWQSIVDWALPLYQLDEQTPDELLQVATSIQAQHASKTAQIGAALRWVQDEIRYYGVELGADSHLPARPEQTLRRRFGDCKGKTLLLMSLLDAMGIESSPALVDTSRDLLSASQPWRLHAFDHVIVHLQIEGKSHWLDPTRTYQRGALGEFHQPDYGRALIIAPSSSTQSAALKTMHNAFSAYRLEIDNTLTLPAIKSQPAKFSVATVRTGRLAESFRRDQETKTLTGLGERYEKYYRDLYGDVQQLTEPSFVDLETNQSTVEEHYQLGDLWLDDEGEKYRWLWANELVSWIEEPPEAQGRTQAFAQSHPVDVTERWRINMPSRYRFDDLDKHIKTPWFEFHKTHQFNEQGTELLVSMRYTSLVDHVRAEDLAEYKKQLEIFEDNVAFLVYRDPALEDFFSKLKSALASPDSSSSGNSTDSANTDSSSVVATDDESTSSTAMMGGILLGSLMAGLLILVGRWARRRA